MNSSAADEKIGALFSSTGTPLRVGSRKTSVDESCLISSSPTRWSKAAVHYQEYRVSVIIGVATKQVDYVGGSVVMCTPGS